MISTDQIKDYLKEWEEDPAGGCHNNDWHLEWRKSDSNTCFRYLGKGSPSLISLRDKELKRVNGEYPEYLIVWDFRVKNADIYRIVVGAKTDKTLYLSPFTGKMQ